MFFLRVEWQESHAVYSLINHCGFNQQRHIQADEGVARNERLNVIFYF